MEYPLAIAVSSFTVTVFGTITNFLIFITILLTTRLHTRCYILIGYLALADTVVCLYYSILRIFIFMKYFDMPNKDCFFWSSYGLFAMNVQAGLTLMLALDRFLAIFIPTKYRLWNAKWYIFFMCIPPNAYAIFMIVYTDYYSNLDLVKICLPPTAYSIKARGVWTLSQVVICTFVLLLYTATQLLFSKLQAKTFQDGSGTEIVAKRVFRTLAVVMLVYTGTWMFFLYTPIQPIIELWLVWPAIINASSSFCIYIWRSREFRVAFVSLRHRKKDLRRPTFVSEGAYLHSSSNANRGFTIISMSKRPYKRRNKTLTFEIAHITLYANSAMPVA